MSEEKKRPPKQNRFELVGELVRIFCRDGRWHANYQLDGKQCRLSLKTRSQKEAHRRALRLEDEILEGRHQRPVRPPAIESVIHDYLQYLETEGRAKKTLVKYRKVFDRVKELAQQRRARTILDLNLSFADAYRHQRAQAGAAGKTIDTETVVIRQLVNFALSRKLISTDPLEGLKIKKSKPTPQPCWSWEEVERILAASREPQRSVFLLLADTGMRIGEAVFLTWDDIDFTRGVVHIRAKEGWKPKTGDQRAVPMTARVQAMLRTLPPSGRWVFTARKSKKHPQGDRQMSPRRLLVSLKRVLKKLGLAGHLHTFRHSFISHALTRGIPEAIVRQWVGHVDRDIIRLYTHIMDEASHAAMKRLDAGAEGPALAKDRDQDQTETEKGTK